MSIALHAGPEEEVLAPRGPNPEYLAFACEMLFGIEADLSTPVMQRIAAVWRGPGSWEERMLATVEAAESACPGLWRAIVTAPAGQVACEDFRYKQHVEREQAAIAACGNSAIAAARSARLAQAARDHSALRGNFSNWLPTEL